MNCILCHRELKHPTPSGLGRICATKNLRGTGDSPKAIIEIVYNNNRGNRNYLIRTANRKIFVVVNHGVIRCHHCSSDKCGHTETVRETDRVRFADEYASKALCLSERKLEFVEALRRGADSNLEVFADFDENAFVVVNLESGAEYNVKLTTRAGLLYAECVCPDFEHRRRICKHVAETLTDLLFKVSV